MGWGSGTAEFPVRLPFYSSSNSDSDQTPVPCCPSRCQASADGTILKTSTTDSTSSAAAAASAAATAIVFINSDSCEGYITVEGNAGDRNNLDPWHSGNSPVTAVANVNKNTIIVVHSVGPLIRENILAQPNVVAIVWAGIPGQESGNGLVDVLYSSTAPSGKLPCYWDVGR